MLQLLEACEQRTVPTLRDFALQTCSMFGSTCLCESTFSDTRNRMPGET